MAYTRQEFALDLKEKIRKKESVKSISEWAAVLYDKHRSEIDLNFIHLLSDLEEMSKAPEYEFTHEELDEFANRLIAGELDLDIYHKKALAIKRKEVGLLLKEKVQKKEKHYLIGRWAWSVYSNYIGYLEDDVSELLSDLSMMETPEFELSYEKLDNIADKLIAGERVINIYGDLKNPVYKNR